jgi:hypothetical protein
MLEVGVRYAVRYEPGHGISIGTFLYRRMRQRYVDWMRQTMVDKRFGRGRSRRRPPGGFVSIDELPEASSRCAALGCRPGVHDVTADDLGVALVPWPVELGDEIAVEGNPWPLEVVDLVWTPPGARVAAIVKVRPSLTRPPTETSRDHRLRVGSPIDEARFSLTRCDASEVPTVAVDDRETVRASAISSSTSMA